MAVKSFEEIYSGLSAQEKTLLDNVFAKEPDLKGGWMRQDDYSRKTQELSTQRAESEEAIAYKKKMEPWAEDAYDRLHTLEEAGVIAPEEGGGYKVLWTEQKSALERQLEEAKALGGDVDPAKLQEIVDARVKEIAKNAGGLTREEIIALQKSESQKLIDDGFTAREAKFNSETIPFIAGFAAANAVVVSRYERESGEKWTPEKQKEFFAMMSAKQKFDPFALEDELLEPVKAKKQRESDIEAEVQRRLTARGMPGGGGERTIQQPFTGGGKGALQMALEKSGAAETLSVEDAVRAAVVEGSKELIETGKF
jgi:hypothetical protein